MTQRTLLLAAGVLAIVALVVLSLRGTWPGDARSAAPVAETAAPVAETAAPAGATGEPDANPAHDVAPAGRAGSIEGVLLDHEGRPAASFEVQARGPEASVVSVRADTSGGFALRELLPGAWSLSSVGSDDVPVEVRAGEVAHVELRLAPPSFLVGRVTCAGQPVAGAKLQLRREGSPTIGSATGSDGRFKLQVAVGTWEIHVSTDAGGAASTTVDVPRGESRRADFDLPNGALVIRAQGPHGEPAAEARLALDRRDAAPGDGGGWIQAGGHRTEADGSTRFGQLPAGHYRVRSLPAGTWLPGEPVEVDVGADGEAEVTVSLRPAANIVGRLQVAEGQALPPGTTVSLYRASGEPAGSSRADRDGSFAFDGLEPGGYVLGVYPEAPDKLGDKPALVDQAITLEGGQQAEVSLVLPAQG